MSSREDRKNCIPLERSVSGSISGKPCNGETHILIDQRKEPIENVAANLNNSSSVCPVTFTFFRKNESKIEKTLLPDSGLGILIPGRVELVTVTCAFGSDGNSCSASVDLSFTECVCCNDDSTC